MDTYYVEYKFDIFTSILSKRQVSENWEFLLKNVRMLGVKKQGVWDYHSFSVSSVSPNDKLAIARNPQAKGSRNKFAK